MKKRLVQTCLIIGMAIAVVGIGWVASLDAQAPQGGAPAAPAGQGGQGARGGGGGGGRGAAAATAPCGPKSVLPADLGKNVAPNSRCFELRMYTVDPTRDGVGNFKGGINELHQRFREKELEIFKKHGAEVIAAWQNLGTPNMLVWMLAFKDQAHRDAVWAAFNADPDWTALRNKYFVPLQGPVQHFLSATDYSPLK
jgi:hypothetical protein